MRGVVVFMGGHAGQAPHPPAGPSRLTTISDTATLVANYSRPGRRAALQFMHPHDAAVRGVGSLSAQMEANLAPTGASRNTITLLWLATVVNHYVCVARGMAALPTLAHSLEAPGTVA